MSVIRAFIAVNLSQEIHLHLDHLIRQPKKRLPGKPIRWVPTKNIHLTIKFLGDVSESNLEMLENILHKEAKDFSPFEISVGELGAFPSMRRPRVVWVGVETPSELIGFHRSIESETSRLGYTPEKRAYSPHLTIGRISRNASSKDVYEIGEVLCKCKVGFMGATRIAKVHLYRSDLKPGGAIYTKLYSAPFVPSNQ